MASRIEETGNIDIVFKETIEKAELRTRYIAMSLFRNVILKTPVDTGRARANWTVTIQEPSTKTFKKTDKKGNETLNLASKKVDKFKLGNAIYLSNNLPYIGKLEYGSSKQAPNGMIRTSLQEIKNEINEKMSDVLGE